MHATSNAGRRHFLTPAAFALSLMGWFSVAAFLWTRDFLLVGPAAVGLRPTEMLLTTQSMLMWAAFTPFILTTAMWIELDAGRRLRAVGIHLLLALLVSAVDVFMDLVIDLFTHLDPGTFMRRFYRESFINCFSYTLIAAVGYAIVYQRRLVESRVNSLELERELAQSKLETLSRTLQPHFLFNALNTVAALVRLGENKRGLNAVVAISELLRTVLKHGGDVRVPLREELEFTERYVSVEQLRFEDRLSVEADVPSGCEMLLVPALILQPLIENAIRHGIEVSGRGLVTIEANVSADWLVLVVRVRSYGEGGEPKVSGLGIGLDVTRRRLAYLYGESRFALDLLVGCGHSSVSLRIPREETVYVRPNPHHHRG